MLVCTVIGVAPSALSCVSETAVPPTLMLDRPSSADNVTVPAWVSDVSPAVVRPASLTVTSPVATPLPSTGVIVGAPSVTPLIVMVNVVLLVSPSVSVMV